MAGVSGWDVIMGFAHRRVPGWQCNGGRPDEDHDWVLVPGESDVGIGDTMECAQCGKQREPTDREIAYSYDDSDEWS